MEKASLAATELANLDTLEYDNIIPIAQKLVVQKNIRVIITDHSARVLYDSASESNPPESYEPYIKIQQALTGKDVFDWLYYKGTMRSLAAIPSYSYQELVGCVYIEENDPDLGLLIHSLQLNILVITSILEIIVIILSIMFSHIFSRRMGHILNSIRIIQNGDYSHKLKMKGNDELTALANEFNTLTDELQVSERKRQQFVSDASHELKTPLASIKLLADSILQNQMDAETTKEFVEDIGIEADRLNRMAQKLLTLTKSEAEATTLSEVIYMTPTIQKVVRMIEAIAAKNSITICVDNANDSPVVIPEDELYQIAFNLVENGIKYNIPGGRLDITLARNKNYAILEVKDTGVGIHEESLSHIFERFYRVDKARSRKSGGTGLGLSIVRNMVERNKGIIKVTSKIGVGTCFQISLPTFDTD